MKIILLSLLFITTLFSSQVEITAKSFSADETKLTSEFIGNVNIIKESDKLTADRVLVNFNKQKQPIKYTATGNVKVKMKMNDKTYDATGHKLTYEPNENRYILLQNAFLHEIDTDKKIYGEKIEINQLTGTYKVDGNNTPVKFIFQIEDKSN